MRLTHIILFIFLIQCSFCWAQELKTTKKPTVGLSLSGGGAIALDVECIELQVADTGGAWRLSTTSGASVNGTQGLMFVPRASVRTASLPGDSSAVRT